MRKIFILTLLLSFCSIIFGEEYKNGLLYQCHTHENHQIHVLDIDRQFFKIIAVKAPMSPTNKQTVSSLVQQHNAYAGINGGFFHGPPREGQPAGILKIQADWLGFARQPRAAIGWQENTTAVLMDKITAQKTKGNAQSTVQVKPPAWQTLDYIVGGMPLLIKNGQILSDQWQDKLSKTFTLERHARTAVCVKENSHWLWIVAAHTKANDRPFVDHVVEGLTLDELAHFMQLQGCHNAINLDGGGSSTMVLDAAIKNDPAGDQDDIFHYYHERPVSDALLLLAIT